MTRPEISQDHYRDFVVLELLEWFKTDFFVWVDDVVCKKCNAILSPKNDEEIDLEEGGGPLKSKSNSQT